MAHLTNPVVAEQCCAAVRNIAANDDNQVKLGAIGACEALIKVMNIQIQNGNVMMTCCGAISNLAIQMDNKNRLGASGISSVIVKVLNIHIANPGVMEQCCRFNLINTPVQFNIHTSLPLHFYCMNQNLGQLTIWLLKAKTIKSNCEQQAVGMR